jgi:trans-2,3-dihydro-3-hydroxyanthranilate isomerase
MDFTTVSVFLKDDPLTGGNPLAVFTDGKGIPTSRMQLVAKTMNLSESSFVTATRGDSYDVRIFTPHSELPFAGHPTIGTAWVLRRLGLLQGDEFTQHSTAGATPLRSSGDLLWFVRNGFADEDLERRTPDSTRKIAQALRLDEDDIGLEAREIGRSGFFRPAFANAGFSQLMVPLRSVEALGRCRPDAAALAELGDGMYCFTGVGAGKVRARGFFAPVGVEEDAATGSAAAALGIYLGARVEPIELEITQGVEMGRPSAIFLKASEGEAQIGGRTALIYRGHLEASL